MKSQTLIIAAALTTILAACSSTDKDEGHSSTSNIPQWVLNPEVSGGIAATDCVKFSGNLSIDKKMATANGRLALAQQIDTRIEGLDKTYTRRTDTNEQTSVGTTFSSVSKQLTKQKLNGTRAIRSDIVDIVGVEHFCVLTTLTPDATKELFDAIIKQSKRDIHSNDQQFMYEEFRAQQAEIDLDKEIQRLTN